MERPLTSPYVLGEPPARATPWCSRQWLADAHGTMAVPYAPPLRPRAVLALQDVWQASRRRRHLPQALHGLDLTQLPVIDARCVPLTPAGWYYARFRGLQRWLSRHGAPYLPALLPWSPHPPIVRGPKTKDLLQRWTPRVVGPLWLCPRLHPHTMGGLDPHAPHPMVWLSHYRRWWHPSLHPHSGLVLDPRHLTRHGVGLPLPDAMAAALRPYVRVLRLADVPNSSLAALLSPAPSVWQPWCLSDLPWSAPAARPYTRFSRDQWQAFVAQFPEAHLWSPTPPAPWLLDG